ncbi:kinase [Hirsutella rhossiliensis]|uniref:Kinase n=1 Tax=Hirsutella rhossiliensis TaxID=111463 RepID=A0A9P8MX21_9HYPO|nr:kinase [Hirsutella rhossiliensis]KAH0962830.1 kinase [Hirsutella rhossiliensis]
MSRSVAASDRSSDSSPDPTVWQQPREFPSTVRIGEVIRDRYQVVAKLGYGMTSTVWLSRDLRERKYLVLKVYINTLRHNQELEVYRHDVLVMKPLGMSLRTFQEMQKNTIFKQDLVSGALDQVLLGLNFLHEANVVHTDLHSDNLLIALTDDSILAKVEDNEINTPSARKRIGDTIIYASQYVLGGAGRLTITDFGQARIGVKHSGNAMPVPYRAPEVILGLPWGPAVDTWSVGLLAWDLLEKESLFRVYDGESEDRNNACHLAAMTAFLGPPPPQFLRKSPVTRKYWDEDGRWNGPVPLPTERTFERLVRALDGEDRDLFLNFVQCFLWLQ